MSNEPLTTAEQIEQMNKLVKWVVWQIATMSPDELGPLGEIPDTHYHIINSMAERLFLNPFWTAEVTGKFIAHQLNTEDSVEWAAFLSGATDD